MKNSHIDYIMKHPNFSSDALKHALGKTTQFPIFKAEEKVSIDELTAKRTKCTTYFCGNCNHKFEEVDGNSGSAQCPECGNLFVGYQSDALKNVADDFTFDELPDIAVRTDEEIDSDKELQVSTYRMCVTAFTNGSPKTNTFHHLSVLEKHIVDGITYYALRWFRYNWEFSVANATKQASLNWCNNLIIFGDNEIVAVGRGRRTSAKLARVIFDYYWYSNSEQIVYADSALFKEFSDTVMNYSGVGRLPSPFGTTNEKFYFTVCLDGIDEIRNRVKKSSSSQRNTVSKRDAMVNAILSNMPARKSFAVDDGILVLRDLECDSLNQVTTYRFDCFGCGAVADVAIPDSRFYLSSSEKTFSCPHCGKQYDVSKTMRYHYNKNAPRTVQIVDNYEDGIVVYDVEYIQTLNGNQKIFTPKPNVQAKHIAIITPNPDGGWNTVNLRHNCNRYVITRNYVFGDEGNAIIKNFATNLNAQWSGADVLFNSTGSPSVDETSAYILLYQMYPVLEKIVKEGLPYIARNIIASYDYVASKADAHYDLNAQDVAGALRLSRGCINILKLNSQGYSTVYALTNLQALYAQDKNLTEEQYAYMTAHSLSPTVIADLCRKYQFTVRDVCGYIERARTAQCLQAGTALSSWVDYLSAAKAIGCDITDRRVRYPSALRTEHDKVVYKKKIIQDEKYEKRFNEIAESYGKTLCYSGKDFLVTYPKSLTDLFEEGRKLHHCVGTYGDRISEGDSVILFIRRKDRPDEPYYTMEVNPRYNAVTQIHGFDSYVPSPKKDAMLLDFVKTWAKNKNIIF